MTQVRLRRLLKAAISLSLIFPAQMASAGPLRFAAMGGYGDSVVEDNSVKIEESPVALDFNLDYSYDEHIVIGAEHLRTVSLAPFSTGVSFTGVNGKWYFLNSYPQSVGSQDTLTHSSIMQVAFAPYAGLGFGFAQSSLISSRSQTRGASAVGAYFSPRIGTDYPLYRWVSARAELGYASTFQGTGTVQTSYLILGFVVYLP